MAKLLVFILCVSMATTQRNGNIVKETKGADHEIQRQNRITEQILTNFLERKLFPNRRPQQKAPTIDEILPAYVDEPANSTKTRNKHSTLQPDDDELSLSEQDALQSVESEHVDSFYQDRDDEGRSLGIRGVGIF